MSRPIVACFASCLIFCFTGLALATAQSGGADQVDRYTTQDGTQVELHSGQLPRQPDGPAPAFAALDGNGDGSLDENEATGYRLLADDFDHADGNRDHRISSAEYASWTRER
jgi:hypothetical protein